MTAPAPTIAMKDMAPGEFVCVGHVLLEGEKLGVALRLLKPDNSFAEREDRFYLAKNFKRVHAGNVYRIPYSGTSIACEDRRYLRAWADEKQAAEWEARSAAAISELSARNAEKKIGDVDAIARLLAPLRQRWEASGHLGRIGIELLVLRALRRGA